MPYANMKVPAGTLSTDQKKQAVEAITDLYVEFYGEQARPNVLVLVDEVVDGGWGIGGQVLTKAMLDGH
jgi:4-oxalocrotonate tautomerase